MHANGFRRQLMSWLLLSLILLARPGWAQPALDVATVETAPRSLTTFVSLLEDRDGTLTLADVQRPDVAARFEGALPEASALSLGFTRSAYWFRLSLHNSGAQPLQRLLVVENPRIAHIQAHLPDGRGGYRSLVTGSDTAPSTRVYANRNFVFPLTLPPHAERVIYLRMESNIGLVVPLQLWPVQAFSAHARDDYVGKAWYFGIATAMILFNLMLFVALRDRIYLLYVLFVVCTAGALAIKNGLAPGAWLNSNVAYYTGVSLALAALLQFARRMLQTAQIMPRTDRLLAGMIVLYLVTPAAYALALPLFSRAAILLNLATALVIFGVALACAIKRQRSAYFFLAAFA